MRSPRRDFIKHSTIITGGLFFSGHLQALGLMPGESPSRVLDRHLISVVHTNDLHNNIEPFTDGKFAGYGGIKSMRECVSSSNVLLDAGDFLDRHASPK